MNYFAEFFSSLGAYLPWNRAASGTAAAKRPRYEEAAVQTEIVVIDETGPQLKKQRLTSLPLRERNSRLNNPLQNMARARGDRNFQLRHLQHRRNMDENDVIELLDDEDDDVQELQVRSPRRTPAVKSNKSEKINDYVDLVNSRDSTKMSVERNRSPRSIMSSSSYSSPQSLQQYKHLLGAILQENRTSSLIDLTESSVSTGTSHMKLNGLEALRSPQHPISAPITIDLTQADTYESLGRRDRSQRVKSVNSFGNKINSRKCTDPNYVEELIKTFQAKKPEFDAVKKSLEQRAKEVKERNDKNHHSLVLKRLKEFTFVDFEIEEPKQDLPELTSDMLAIVENAWVGHSLSEVLSSKFRLNIKRKDLHTLQGYNWLNDEVINFYMELIMERSEKEGYPSVHAFNTFFYPSITQKGYVSVKRWTRKVDIFSKDLILVPIHLQIHWCMAAIDVKKKTVVFHDSLGSSNEKAVDALLQYLKDEHMDKRKSPLDVNEWKLVPRGETPRQENGSDCGVFSCMTAEFISRRSPLTYDQEHMPYFRKKMVYEIIKGQLIN